MGHRHLSSEDLARVERGEVEGKEVVRAMLMHLLEVCPQCRRAWRQAALPSRDPLGAADYHSVIERALARARERAPSLEDELGEAPGRVAELLATPERELPKLLETAPRFLTWGVCDLLIRECHRAAFEDPGVAASLGRLAISLSNRLNPQRYGEAFLKDVRAMAWAYYGNALRVGSDLRQSEQAFQMSEELVEEGTGDPLIRAEWSRLLSSLRRDQRRFEESLSLLDEAGGIYRRAGDRLLESRVLVKTADCLREAGMPGRAIAVLEESMEDLESAGDDHLLLCVHHNLTTCLLEQDRAGDALLHFQQTSALYDQYQDFATQTRRLWLEGRLRLALGQHEQAEAAFTATRKAFLERGIGYDAALVSLELAALYFERGEITAVKRLAEEMLPIFRSRDVHREAMAALLLFQQATRNEALSREFLLALSTYLRRARRDSSLRFADLDQWREPS